jgi:hypothetical protein
VVWQKVNWILNNKPNTWATPPWSWTHQDVQEAIWFFVDHGTEPTTAVGKALRDSANVNYGSGYYPKTGDYYAVAVYISSKQQTIIEVITDRDIPVELSSFTATSDGGRVALQWVTQSETDNLGFHVYRSLTEDGEYAKITAALIKGAGDSRRARIYEFIDSAIQPGRTYCYKLEQIDFTGVAAMSDPVVVTVIAKPAVQTTTWGRVKSLLR